VTAGRRVRCRHCGHVWRDNPAVLPGVVDALGAAAEGFGQSGAAAPGSDHGSTVARLVKAVPPVRRPPAAEWVGRSLGRYDIRSVLGQGAMGYVYEAYDRDLRRVVALKVLPRRIDPARPPIGLKLFLQEARLAARLQHPGLTTIFEIGEQEGIHYFAMERVEGTTLAALVEQSGPLPANQACYVIAHAARALAAGHRLGIVHRDVKPSNVMLNTAGQVKLTDFGLACGGDVDLLEQAGGGPVGTPGWIAPEVARGQPASPASDIYSLGLTLYFVMTRQRLVRGDTKSGLIRFQQNARPVRRDQLPAGWPPRLKDIIVQCLQPDPVNRYTSAEVLVADLTRALSPDSADATLALGDASRPPARQLIPDAIYTNRPVILLILGLILALMTAAAWLML
jgi:serine/threonine-protein kinase